ncbi:protein kinase domain-containing protein [Cordyceps javanica]|uniref:non-specific serine/threonine protein kinase n=1 Tax=Cordyceps javanica TaxID=43265 RepID=A0A545ULH7_9HYPO|nr:protein kinase domain-containing protein [Cordyceps javanica]
MRTLARQTLYQRLACKSRHLPTTFRRKMATSPIRYEFVEEVEDISNYAVGGFHPVRIGDCYHGRYRVVHKLGHGIGIADWETQEAKTLSTLAKGTSTFSDLFPLLLDQFEMTGPNGKHKCLVLEAARCSLAASKKASWIRLFHLRTARILAAQMAIAVHQMHNLHLGNVLLQLPRSLTALSEEQLYSQFDRPTPQAVVREDKMCLSSNVPAHVYEAIWMGMPTESLAIQDAKILLSDFGVASQPEKESQLQSNTPINFRPPETRFEQKTPLTPAADIWSLACMIWDVMAQRPLFGEILATTDMITSQHINTLGAFPRDWWNKWDAKWKFFKSDGTPIESQRTPSWSSRFERDIQGPRREKNMGGSLDIEEAQAFTFMLRSMLAYQPADRPTAEEILNTEWMRKYALPDLQRSEILEFDHAKLRAPCRTKLRFQLMQITCSPAKRDLVWQKSPNMARRVSKERTGIGQSQTSRVEKPAARGFNIADTTACFY